MHFWYSRRYIRASSILVTDTIELRRSDQVKTDDLHKEWIRECGVYDGHGAQENGQEKSCGWWGGDMQMKPAGPLCEHATVGRAR